MHDYYDYNNCESHFYIVKNVNSNQENESHNFKY